MKKQITFPIVIKKKGVPFQPPDASLYYILAADGWYVVKKNKMYETCSKVDHAVPGYEPQKEYCRTSMPVIPNEIMDKVMSFFRRVHDDLGGEAIVELFYEPDSGEWLASPPWQGIPQSSHSAYSGMGSMFGMDVGWSSGSGKAPDKYGTAFEEHADISATEKKWEKWDKEIQKYVPCPKGTKGAVKALGQGYWAHDLVYKASTSEEWPEGYRRIGTIHSHPSSSAYFSTTDDADDKYGDGMHIVFGMINNASPKVEHNVKASFCSNGQRFEWDKKDNDSIMEEFVDCNTAVDPEWLKRCHEVETRDGKYVSIKPGKAKAKAASEPKPVKGGKAAKPSNVRRIDSGKAMTVGDRVEFQDRYGNWRHGIIQYAERGGYGITWWKKGSGPSYQIFVPAEKVYLWEGKEKEWGTA
jgi:hypothetical protein